MFIELYNHCYGHVENDPCYKFYKHSFGYHGKRNHTRTRETDVGNKESWNGDIKGNI